ncbi:MAG TPA: UDP-N-acetylmuramoyl-tripeptide--D-alanyl-D-alanine ligase [Woeseiaceae bacterium]|nr:UDP-N-acetylmuramoyl-tripeptide--D-alanyl-D-alanine ligase [Woeseiaceae bacterium]
MIESTLARASERMAGRLHGGDAAFRGVSTDTRTLVESELFFALEGPSFDGGEFLPQAAAAGAAGAVVGKPVESALPVIEVADTRRALGTLAGSWRRRMPASVVGVTGSNGKTTLKEMIASCLALAGPTLATRGNLNNDVGVPLMLARLDLTHRHAVFEMGANHPGEIAWLTSLVVPDIAVITNAGPAHLEGFGTIEGVAKAKGEILQGEPRPAWAVLNADDRHCGLWRRLAGDIGVRTFGLAEDADVRAVDVAATAAGTTFTLVADDFELPLAIALAGRHNAELAAAAAAVASIAGLDPARIRRGLETAGPVSGRLNALAGIEGCTLYDDSYNANPASVIAAAEFLSAGTGEPWLVLGDMGELGDDSEMLHRQVGETLAAKGIARLFATGPLSRNTVEGFGEGGAWFESAEALIDAASRQLSAMQAHRIRVLVKGSRAMHMETVVQALAARAPRRED